MRPGVSETIKPLWWGKLGCTALAASARFEGAGPPSARFTRAFAVAMLSPSSTPLRSIAFAMLAAFFAWGLLRLWLWRLLNVSASQGIFGILCFVFCRIGQ